MASLHQDEGIFVGGEWTEQIRAINADPALSAQEKSMQMQRLMMNRWNSVKSQKLSGNVLTSNPSESGRSDLDVHRTDDRCRSYHNKASGTFGCKHYSRSCQIVAACCGQTFPCRLCHDEHVGIDHKIDRFATREMICMHCGTQQPCGQACSSCKKSLALYYCDVCRFWDDDPHKDIYHCPHCGLCRRGKGLDIDFRHCQMCNACVSVEVYDDHKCVEQSLHSNCPVCAEFLFTSTAPVMFLSCGHAMHSECFELYVQTAYACPICKKSVCDMRDHFAMLDEHLSEVSMPPEYANQRAEILCNDCVLRSVVPFRFIYHSCAHCRSYNTQLIRSAPDLILTVVHESRTESGDGGETMSDEN